MDAEKSAAFLLDEGLRYVFSGALRVAAQTGVADHLTDGPRTVEHLAARTATQADGLRRVLRLLATRGIFHEDAAGRFHLTPLGEALRSDCPSSVREAMVFVTNPTFWQPVGRLGSVVSTGVPAVEQIFGRPLFDYLAANPEAAAEFDPGMAQYSQLESRGFATTYDFADTGVLVDVGGGRGRLLLEVLRRHPGWRGVLFDQHHVVARHDLAALGADHRWTAVPGDFFDEVPAGGDVYALQYILHDWDDERCVRILRNCRRAMNPNGRVVALDTVLPEGDAAHPGKSIDLVILASFTGRERTRAQFAALFEAAGLRLTRVIAKPEPGWLSIIEGRPH
ncbi:methyltransferase [Micromonospora sp. HUAS LYJ1]|uniref:methyltransferase n=1 Tax=Micromonospora sp. HUAS LYJ1 TaxID=3061626 RepID=UPI002672C97F|nr:methyltransferase [Micromonospora sp. HUAS LYJ1]WKU05692.1 methyltransferase [Micromonospora sp. HUAS LYJ1]